MTNNKTYREPRVFKQPAFRPHVSCAHLWRPHWAAGPVNVVHGEYRQECVVCGATCTRDAGGAIIEYAAGRQLSHESYDEPVAS